MPEEPTEPKSKHVGIAAKLLRAADLVPPKLDLGVNIKASGPLVGRHYIDEALVVGILKFDQEH